MADARQAQGHLGSRLSSGDCDWPVVLDEGLSGSGKCHEQVSHSIGHEP